MSSTSTLTIVLVLRPPCNNDYYWLFIFALCNIFMNILIVLRPPCKQQTISFESWNLNSARPKNSDWSWFGEKLARSNFPLIHLFTRQLRSVTKQEDGFDSDCRLAKVEKKACVVCERPWDPISICIGPRPRSNTISNTELLQTVTKYALGQNQNPHWTDLQVSTA